jgi:hypothetical protein
MIEEITVPGVARLPVMISGCWSAPPKRDWRGFARATEPIVAIAFLRLQHHVEWGLSSSTEDTEIETRLSLFPYDKTCLDVQVSVSKPFLMLDIDDEAAAGRWAGFGRGGS